MRFRASSCRRCKIFFSRLPTLCILLALGAGVGPFNGSIAVALFSSISEFVHFFPISVFDLPHAGISPITSSICFYYQLVYHSLNDMSALLNSQVDKCVNQADLKRKCLTHAHPMPPQNHQNPYHAYAASSLATQVVQVVWI